MGLVKASAGKATSVTGVEAGVTGVVTADTGVEEL